MTRTARCEMQKAIAGLSDREAVAYLLDTFVPRVSAKAQLYDHFGVHVSPAVAETLRALTRRPGYCIEHAALAAASSWPMGSDASAADHTNTRIKNLRRVISKNKWPIEIEAIQCVGYAAHITDPEFRLPWG